MPISSMKRFRQYLSEQVEHADIENLLQQYHESLPPEKRAGEKEFNAKDVRQCTTGNCATHAKGFVEFAQSKGFPAKAMLMQGPEFDHIVGRIGNKIIDPTHYQFSGEKPNSIGGHITDVEDFAQTYGQHGYDLSKTMTGEVSEIEKTPYEKGGAGGKLNYE